MKWRHLLCVVRFSLLLSHAMLMICQWYIFVIWFLYTHTLIYILSLPLLDLVSALHFISTVLSSFISFYFVSRSSCSFTLCGQFMYTKISNGNSKPIKLTTNTSNHCVDGHVLHDTIAVCSFHWSQKCMKHVVRHAIKFYTYINKIKYDTL